MAHPFILSTISLFVYAIVTLFPVSVLAQPEPTPDGPVDNRIRLEVIDSLASILINGYFDPATAKKMIAKIKNYHKAGKYQTIKSGQQFALALTQDLIEVSKDKHIRVEYVNAAEKKDSAEIMAAQNKKQQAFMAAVNHGFDKVERLPGNVGLLELRTFNAAIDKTTAKIDAAMKLLADTDALIIDLRYNSGGKPLAVEYLASYLLDSKPQLFNTMRWRTAAGNQPVN